MTRFVWQSADDLKIEIRISMQLIARMSIFGSLIPGLYMSMHISGLSDQTDMRLPLVFYQHPMEGIGTQVGLLFQRQMDIRLYLSVRLIAT